MNETELILKAQQGDKKALAKLVKAYEQTIYNFAFKICRDKYKAEHIMQETFYSMVNPCTSLTAKLNYLRGYTGLFQIIV